jgi:hypothetical protein
VTELSCPKRVTNHRAPVAGIQTSSETSLHLFIVCSLNGRRGFSLGTRISNFLRDIATTCKKSGSTVARSAFFALLVVYVVKEGTILKQGVGYGIRLASFDFGDLNILLPRDRIIPINSHLYYIILQDK